MDVVYGCQTRCKVLVYLFMHFIVGSETLGGLCGPASLQVLICGFNNRFVGNVVLGAALKHEGTRRPTPVTTLRDF